MRKFRLIVLAIFLIFTVKSFAQLGTMVGWGMSVCNTYTFNICPNQTITPFNYGFQPWACNAGAGTNDISFNIMGPGWRVARHNYTYTANVNGQISGFTGAGAPQSMTIAANQSITASAYPVVAGVNCVVFAINNIPTTYTFNQNTFSITINPVVFPPANYTLCSNTQTSISVGLSPPALGGPWTYSWQPGNLTGNPVTVSPTVNTIYTVIATAGACTNLATVGVTVMNCCVQPTLTTVASSGSICTGQSTTLTATGAGPGGTYTWNPGNLTGASIVVSPTANTIYTVTGTNSLTCTGNSTFQVTVNSPPTVTPGSNSPLCASLNLSLTVGAANTYSWSGPGGFSSNMQNPILNNVQLANAGIYSVGVTSTAGCTGTNTLNVIINPGAVITATNGGPSCQGGTITLSVTSGASYYWTGPAGFTSNQQSPVLANGQPSNSGVYSVTVTNAGGCQGISSTTVIVNPSPSVSAGNSGAACAGNTMNLYGSGGATYTWTGPGGYSSTQQNPVISSVQAGNAGIYTLTADNGMGCILSDTTILIVYPLPFVTVNSSSLCTGQTLNLAAGGGNTYTWTGPGGFASNQQNVQFAGAFPAMSGFYTVQVTGANGCINSGIAQVLINDPPIANINANTDVCSGQTVYLNSTSSSGINFNWTGPNNFFSPLQNTQLNNTNVNTTGTYTLTVADNIGCTTNMIINITVRPDPLANIVSGKIAGCVPLCVNLSTQGQNPLQTCIWRWMDGSSSSGFNASKCFTEAGMYGVISEFTDIHGCENRDTVWLEAYPIPVADFNYSPSNPIIDQEVKFQDATYGANATNWSWNFSNLQEPAIVNKNVSMSFENTGSYAVALVVTSDHGCKDTIVKSVMVGEDIGFYVPDAFTPNGDGLNDMFQPKGHGLKKYELSIFDRWGEKLFSTTDFSKGWDGTGNGTVILKEDTYVWKIVTTDNLGKEQEYTGVVNLIK